MRKNIFKMAIKSQLDYRIRKYHFTGNTVTKNVTRTRDSFNNLKVRKSPKQIMVYSILPKNKRNSLS